MDPEVERKLKLFDEMILQSRSALYDELDDQRRNLPQNNDTLTNIILDLHNSNYQFNKKQYELMFYRIIYENWDDNDDDDDDDESGRTFLFRATSTEHKKIINIQK